MFTYTGENSGSLMVEKRDYIWDAYLYGIGSYIVPFKYTLGVYTMLYVVEE